MAAIRNSALQFENLEKRELKAGNITAVAFQQLDGEAAFIAKPLSENGDPRFVVAGTTEGTTFLGTAFRDSKGEFTGDTSIDPFSADEYFKELGQAESGLDIAGREKLVSYIPGSSEGHPALFNSSGALVWSDPAVEGKVSILFETPGLIGLVDKTAGGQQLMIAEGTSIDIPSSVLVQSMLKPIAGESSIYLGGTNASNGRPSILKYDLITETFSEPDDVSLAPNTLGAVKGLSRAANASGEPIAIVEVQGALPGNVPAVGSVWLNDRERVEVFGPSNGGKVIADMGITLYQGQGDWFVHIGSRTMSNLTGLPMAVPIPLSGLLSDAGFGDTIVNDVTSVITDGLGRLYITTDIEVDGFQMASVISVFDPAPLQNKAEPLSTKDDGFISPLDVLVVINYLNARSGMGSSGSDRFGNLASVGDSNLVADDPNFFYLDPNGDNFISPLDALVIINYLNRGTSGGGEGEGAVQKEVAQSLDVPIDRVAALVADLDLVEYFKRRRVTSL